MEPWGDQEIELAARWTGERGLFVSVLRECNLMDDYVVHGWLERAGRLVYDRRRKEQERKSAVERRKKGGKSKATVPNPTQPYPTVPNTTQPDTSLSPPTKFLNFVYLTPGNYRDLTAQLGSRRDGYIARLDGYIGQIGEAKARAKYKSHYHVIMNWYRKDIEEGKISGTHDGPSSIDLKSLARTAREAEKSRSHAPAGAVLDGLRDSADIPDEDGRDSTGSDQ